MDFVDPERIGMWGHSTGGEIALRVIIARNNVDATVLFGSMGADAADNFRLVQGWGAAKLSPLSYLALN